ncbi:hypothetical protein CJD36_004400 [Flavipsychrobacter stenotrophus]|uniref:Antirestriction protein n=1 Tax=Flavipsychrobacter stenotrophus TaxID=2077091 RepID=A0A2S7T289_9BACT|nr:zincin-like metallopeptidase domain-containing protein [Flavipsychrobacter stenotrophus]PQJ12991.1 hypothetical protein CJD36_004400 [Flavipsychrobacter stenotrophus]
MAKETIAKNDARKDVHEIIASKFIEQLEQGRVPWRTMWADGGVPTSLVSKRPFRGINTLLLATLGYDRNLFVTPKQLEAIDGSIRPSEKPHILTFYGEPQGDASGEKKVAKLAYYNVYNIVQCVGIPEVMVSPVVKEQEPFGVCEKIVEGIVHMPAIRNIKDQDVLYDPCEDYINIPKLKSFANPGSYYAALFHQLAHSTGHHTRLNRMGLVQMSEYGCDRHTLEELVAEIVTNYLENIAGIPCPFEPDEEYIDGWLEIFRKDRYFIFNACNLAQKAIDFIMNIQDEEKDQVEE